MEGKWIRLVLLLLAVISLNLLLAHVSVVGGTEPITLAEHLPTPRPSEICDLCEPNNSLSQACGPLAASEHYQYFIRCTANRDDYYYIDLEMPGTVTLDLTDIPSGSDYDLYLLYDGNVILDCYSDDSGNLPEHVVCPLDRPGRYHIWVYAYKGCNDNAPYTLSVTYPTPTPTPIPTSTPSPPCNVHIDDFGDTDPQNDLDNPSGWELDPAGCANFSYTGHELQLSDWISGECTALYTTTLSLDASPYNLLTFEVKGNITEILTSTVIGLRDNAGHEMRVKAGDFMNQVSTETWQGVDLPLAVFATTVDTSQLDTLFFQFVDTPGTIYLDSLRLEAPLAPLTVDNFDDLAEPNALGGGTGIYTSPGAIFETAYTTSGTYDNSPGGYVLSYTLPAGEWALWETYLPGLDVSEYAFLFFYVKGANGGEKVNLYLEDGSERRVYVNVEAYAPIATHWTPVRVPLQAFEGVALTDLTKLKFVFEWDPMASTIFLDDLRFVAGTLLIDNFCDDDENNSLNGEVGTFTSAPSCDATVTPSPSDGTLRLDYDVTAGADCFSGYHSRMRLDLNPYRSLAVKVRGESCGQVAAISARTIPVATEKIKLGDYLLDGITDQWQQVRIPLAASSVVTDWTRGDAYVIAFEARKGASEGTAWWDDVAFETACAPLWVDNFNDQDNVNALDGSLNEIGWEAEISTTTTITAAYGDGGAGLALTYAVPVTHWVGWETELHNVDLSNYDRLIFHVKRAGGGENPHIYLGDGDGKRRFVEMNDYADPLSTEWQTIVIQLQSFYGLDLTRVQVLQIIIEWENTRVEGSLIVDDVRFLPSADCSQLTQNLTFLPLMAKDYTPLTLVDPVWDFESGLEGWTTYRTDTTSRATMDVVPSTFRSLWGNASLAMILNLVGGDDRFDRGVAYVDLSEPTDLACKPLSCWIYVPTCGLGDPAEPNWVQIFVKDANDRDEYGTPAPVVRNQWFEVRLYPSTLLPHEGSMEDGFDPHTITRVGVQFGAGSQETIYRGKVFLDACGWREIDPVGTASIDVCRPDKASD
jgi:hypothetical protein